jgi:17beta-estradiol 17-dehydrogenase / very-long-chain 3-oxoacyl-CoA reductase
MFNYLFLIIELYGLRMVLYLLYLAALEIYKCLKPLPNIQSKYGKDCWAVITGATDGIGKAYV